MFFGNSRSLRILLILIFQVLLYYSSTAGYFIAFRVKFIDIVRVVIADLSSIVGIDIRYSLARPFPCSYRVPRGLRDT